MDYLVVLFKNKEKKKIINKFKTEKRAEDFFNKLILESNDVIFPKEFENGERCYYELAILSKKTTNYQNIYIKDEIGRQIKVDLDDDNYQIKKIKTYNIEELILDCSSNKKITTQKIIAKYLRKSGLKMLSKLNNKVVIQNDDQYNLFTFKSVDDSERFLDILTSKFNEEGKRDCLFVKDYTTTHRKYLYGILVNQGFSIDYLQRCSTTFPSKK